jgi:large subunit ribosomal protein L29
MNASEVHKMTSQELTSELKKLRKQQFDLRTSAVTEKVENPQLIKQVRRDVARILTEQSARQRKETVSA